jgi:predicted O-methyltransferase YrrM
LKRAIKNPRKALNVAYKLATSSSTTSIKNTEEYDEDREDVFSSHLNITPDKISSLLTKFRESSFQDRVDRCKVETKTKPYELGGMRTGGETAYLATRLIEPEAVLEIGVANGVSTTYLLAAAEHGGFQPDFYGIDKPQFESEIIEQRGQRGIRDVGGIIPDSKEAGWVAPRPLRQKYGYQYYVGDFMNILPSVLGGKPEFELIIYDASKNAKEMRFAYEQSINALAPGGVLISDDIDINSAFSDVCSQSTGQFETFAGCGIFFKSK